MSLETTDDVARRPAMRAQIVRFVLVGGLNTASYFALFNLLLHVGMHTLVASVAAFATTNVLSFTLNRVWTFSDDRRGTLVRRYALFAVLTLVGLGLNTITLALLLHPLRTLGTVGANVAAGLAHPVSAAWNFMSYRSWVFGSSARSQDQRG